jgi:uncharacterized DUF497 family protein
MEVIYDGQKARKLLKERKIDLVEIALLIKEKQYVEIISHRKRPGQKICILEYKGYIHLVPFVTQAEDKIIIKTAYPSRKFNKKYGGGYEAEI